MLHDMYSAEHNKERYAAQGSWYRFVRSEVGCDLILLWQRNIQVIIN